ncbi:hypothetical protein [Acinetobacter sp. 10FS3-1]|uniref:hypothetical protein n=1 Tax=Acinetobacter sp. 10FS3-1 TaxID=2563897 RepID=UPI00157C227D|nr:hypothetical protein [Acinetobacter sp. 10FS3-1]
MSDNFPAGFLISRYIEVTNASRGDHDGISSVDVSDRSNYFSLGHWKTWNNIEGKIFT